MIPRLASRGGFDGVRSECSSRLHHHDRSHPGSQLFVCASLDKQRYEVADSAPVEVCMRILYRGGNSFPGHFRMLANESLDYMTDLAYFLISRHLLMVPPARQSRQRDRKIARH